MNGDTYPQPYAVPPYLLAHAAFAQSLNPGKDASAPKLLLTVREGDGAGAGGGGRGRGETRLVGRRRTFGPPGAS
eukprot:1158329-Pelagomonas_calceolata.AAC.12